MEKEPSHTLLIKSKVLEEDSDSLSAKFSESTQNSELVNSLKLNVTVSPTLLMIQKDTESQDGSLTDKKITRKERTFKSPPTFSKPN